MHNKNLYSYCDGNPVDREDSHGELWGALVGGIVGAVVSLAKQQIIEKKSVDEINWVDVGMNAISFAVSTTALGKGVQMVVNAATSCISSWSNGDNIGMIIGNTIMGAMGSGSGAAFGDRLKNVWNVKFRINRINYSGIDLTRANMGSIVKFAKESSWEAAKIGIGYVASNAASAVVSSVDSTVTVYSAQRQIGWGCRYNPKTRTRETYRVYA